MIFKPLLVSKILRGDKTVTRRPIVDATQPCRYQPGESYALQPGRGKKAVARIFVHRVEPQFLGEIDNTDAQREGFESEQAFMEYWAALYGNCDPKTLVWRIEFWLES